MLSIVIPVYNEEENLPLLFKRLYPALDNLKKPYEIIFTNDGSKDTSWDILQAQHKARPDVTKVINFEGNYGQHLAIIAALENSKGQYIITLDADLQNPPEEIHKLVEALEKGYDVVGTYRANRQDTFFRKYASRLINGIRHKITNIQMKDQGCMLRGYSRTIVNRILATNEVSTFIPATAQTYAQNPIEIKVAHEERAFGESKYSLGTLIRLNFDLLTGYSIVPLQVFTLIGVLVSSASFALVALMVYRRLALGAEAEGLFTLFAIVFFLMGILMIGLGIIGEYIGRIYMQVRGRPRFSIQSVLDTDIFAKPVKTSAKSNTKTVTKTVTKTPANKSTESAENSTNETSVKTISKSTDKAKTAKTSGKKPVAKKSTPKKEK